jgi:putative hydrolase of HD superfamily
LTTISRHTTEKVIELAQLCLRFGRVNRVTYHEDGKRFETDTDHTVMLAVIACAFAERINAEDERYPRYDVGRVAQFAIVHDLVEAYAGDTNSLIARTDVGPDDATRTKEAREAAALARIRSEFAADFPWLTDTIDAYESLVSPEARFVKALDKVLPNITHLLNGGATLRQHGVDASNIDAMRATYAADQPAVMALYADVHARLREALVKQDAQPVSDAIEVVVVDIDSEKACWWAKEHLPATHGTDIAKQNAALRACVTYARSKRGKDFDFDTWEAMCEAAMAGEHAPSALEGEIALHAQTRDALIAVRKERDALLVDTCRGASCGKCLCCRAKQPAHDDLEYAQDEAVFELDNTEP